MLPSVLILVALAIPARAETVIVTQDACAALILHEPTKDVAYKPGVDASGNALAPADLEDTARLDLEADHVYRLKIEVPLENLVDIDAGDNIDAIRASDLLVGTVSLEDGQVLFDGKPLGSREAHALAEACRELQEGLSTQ